MIEKRKPNFAIKKDSKVRQLNKRGCVKMYVNVHFDALFSFYGKRPVLSSLSSVPEPAGKESKAAFKERQKQIKELDKQKDKLEEYNRKLATLGNRNSYSKTDKDSTFMHMKEDAMRNGQTKPGYNLQTSTENQFITDFAFYPNPADTLTMPSFLASFKEKYGHFTSAVIADSGYYNKEKDFYVCLMGQHMERTGIKHGKTYSGYITESARYRAGNCSGGPLRGQCFKAKGNRV